MSHEHAKPALQVHLTRWQGQALALCWHWPHGQRHVDLSSVLQALDLPMDADDEAQHCRLHLSEGGTVRMGFEHACRLLRCSLNGRALPASELVWLQEDDVLDIGLLRLEWRCGVEATPPRQTGHEIDEALDLRTLADGTRSAFNDLAAQRAPDALDDLLRSTPSDPLASLATQAPGMAQQPLDVLQPPDKGDPLSQWHAHYLQRLQSPAAALAETDWHLTQSRHNRSSQDPMADLMAKAQDGLPLAGLLGQSEHISAVLAQLDDHGTNPLLSEPEEVHVMHLFAPPGWQAPDSAQVPLLTRQEHHGISLDSAIALPATSRTTKPQTSS